MVTKKYLLQLLGSINAAIVIVIMAIPIVMALPGHAQERQHPQDSNAKVSALAEVAVDVGMKKSADDAGGIIQASEPNVVRQLHEGFRGRKVRVGLYENKPKIFTSETGQPSGIFIELLDEMAQKEKWELVYVPCEWSECLSALDEGRIDLMPDVAFSPERDRKMDFHEQEVIESWSQVYARKENPVGKFSDLNGRRLALLKGSIQQPALEQMITGFGYEVSMVEAHSYEEAFRLAANGTVDAAVSNHLFGDYYYQEYGLVKTAIVFNAASLYFATASGANHDLLEAIDHNLRILKSEPGSVFYKALARWMERPPKVVVPRHFVWLMGGIGGFLALAFVVILVLRRLVITRTRHLVQTNETLRESEEKFRNLFQNHFAVKLIIDPDNGNIVEVNEAAEKFYGWSAEQLRQKRIQDINILPQEQLEALLEKAKQGNKFEFRHRLADGSIKDVEVFSSGIDIKGKTLLHSIIHDVTEHRKLEEQYRQAQKMESVGRLAGGVAHDYNNMLGVILGHTELALSKADPSRSLHAHLTEILNAAKRSAVITRQLLAFARKQTVSPKVLDVNEIAEGMLKMLRRLIGEDIDLVYLPGSNLRPVKIDPSQIEQILANLCVNARDAIGGVGKVTIETHMVTLDEDYCADHAGFVPGEYVMIAASDDGCGMDKETLDHIFEPFFTTKDVHQGTGLGLSTVYGIVKQNNGFINVYSEPGKGTTFRIYLPCHEGKAEKIRAEIVGEIPPSRNEMVLLVEDESAIREMSRLMLERLGYKVLAACTPKEAIRLAAEHPGGIDLLITDVVMPGMSGRDLADELHTFYPDIKILFMSGYTADAIVHRGVLEEDVQFIQKPFSMKDLGIKVREVLDAE